MSKKSTSKKAETVRVVVRCRPMDQKEIKDGHERIVEMDVNRGVIMIKNPKGLSTEPPKDFTFDAVYDWDSKQTDLYEETFRDLVQSVIEGFNGTIFAYGQTGTGKTYTMQGDKNNAEKRGVIPNSFEHIFQHISRSENQQYLIRASYLEIYQEDIRDLLSKDHTRKLELKERPDTGVYVKDLSSFVTNSVKEIEQVMHKGNSNRAVGSTNMNEHSSRSHAIFIITIECSEIGADGENHIRVGRLNLVDLAGSERQSKTGATGDRLREATKINLSLSALCNVIAALVNDKSTHIPYRDAKLTRLLQDSLGGNAKTVMVANIGPASYNYDESLSTLRYANSAKNIKNKPKINEDPKDALLREFQEEIARLKADLNHKGGPKKRRKGKKIRRNADGEVVSGSDEESDDNDEGFTGNNSEDEAEYRREQESKLEEQKNAILSNQTMIQEEKDRILQEITDREEKLKKEQEARDGLAAKIKAMESKLLMGGKNIVDHTNEQQRALEQRRKEIADQKKLEREIQQKLEEKEESAVEMQDTYNSMQHEVEIKTKKLKKLFAKLQSTKAEIMDLQEEHSKERQELEQTQMELTRDLKLKMLIIENFIPVEDKTKVMSRAVYDEDEDMWKLKPLANKNTQTMAKRPTSALGNRRPVSEYARVAAAMGGNPRFKGENILMVELDMPNRTTRDYDGPQVAPRIQAALDAALQDEADIEIEGQTPSIFSTKAKNRKRDVKSARPRTGKRDASKEFPSSRGLVPK
ncbi:kinesin-II 95 kDa subunit-like [Pecten maximus]|uniref:kinesin-II 95 kDa subunit-like n=1 Tax=Pecten maximus TaxID=6579 RepID=UPI001458E7DD|nr:kinesin-II 95 kDa subunit-like [Pecten maximus]XP_033752541.1 kinesin-II 95 kDa subunit-like [Pecten maximus]